MSMLWQGKRHYLLIRVSSSKKHRQRRAWRASAVPCPPTHLPLCKRIAEVQHLMQAIARDKKKTFGSHRRYNSQSIPWKESHGLPRTNVLPSNQHHQRQAWRALAVLCQLAVLLLLKTTVGLRYRIQSTAWVRKKIYRSQ